MTHSSPQVCGLNWIRRKTWPRARPNPKGTISIVDLFCGCGGLTLGAWEAARLNGFALKISFAIDVCEESIAVYRKNFSAGEDVAICDDIKKVLTGALGSEPRMSERRLVKKCKPVDILVAGPPCQGHSDLNNHTRRNDPRNGLYLKVIRAAELLQPRIILIENVGPVVHDKNRVVEKSLRVLDSLGYATECRIVQALDLGLPQRRRCR